MYKAKENFIKFYTITNLQGSQTSIRWQRNHNCFTPLQTYKVLKRILGGVGNVKSFTPLQTYKVLKHCNCQMVWNCSFTPLQTYKVLKQICVGWEQPTVLHHYKLTRFSNTGKSILFLELFYTITNLQGSQTNHGSNSGRKTFYTITNLQGSQTLRTHSMVKISFTPLQTYKVLKPHANRYYVNQRFTPLQTYKVLKLN